MHERASMNVDDVRFLYGYDRWATRRVLNVLGGLDVEVWGQED